MGNGLEIIANVLLSSGAREKGEKEISRMRKYYF